MFFPILLILVAIVAVLFFVVSRQPSDFRISRTAVLSAPAPTVFTQVNNFHNWEAWSPWAKRDPAMKQTYAGPLAGTGAVHTWSGNNQVGEGRMTITESRPNDLIRIKLEFLKPFQAANTAEFTFKPDGNRTSVTWSMSGTKNFMSKMFGLCMDMDKMVGGDFETGLAQMQAAVEKSTTR